MGESVIWSGMRWKLAIAAVLAAVVALAAGQPAPAASTACLTSLPPWVGPTGSSTQLVTVSAARADTTYASVGIWQKVAGCWGRAGGPWPARVGRNGLSDRHREGDGTTPTGSYAIDPTIYGVAPDPGVRGPYHRLVCGDWWDEDPASPGYNTFRHVRCGSQPPFGGGSEALWRITRAYRHFAVVRYNAAPVVPGRGSAIFLHADTGRATNGCVGLPLPRLLAVLRWLRPASAPLIAIAAS
jgi:L,D-peptidoglycan transpeptidase YkuD (ErfK/YbiS/YcfS/YnhG family)